jgi:hypothetical protein
VTGEGGRRTAARPEVVAAPAMRSRPRVVWWAWVGVLFGAIQVVSYLGWFMSGHLTPTVAIAADVPSHVKVSAVIIQALCALTCVGTLVYVVRQCLRARALTVAAVLTIGGASLFWQDSLMNYIRPQAGYNSYYLNLGSLNSDVPGWLSFNGHALPEGLLLELPCYLCLFLYAMLGAAAMRKAQRRWPTMSAAGLIAVGFGTLMAFNLVFELAVNIPSRTYGWSSTIGWLTLFGSEHYRYPIYEGVLSAFVFAPAGVLLFFLDDRGRTVVEQGIDKIQGSSLKKSLYRVLAVSGVMNLSFLLGYTIPINWIALHTDHHYILPPYLSNGTCGVEVAHPCAPSP